MGKTFRVDSNNSKWRKAKHARQHHRGGESHRFDNRAWKEVSGESDEAERLRRDEKNGLYGGVEDIAN